MKRKKLRLQVGALVILAALTYVVLQGSRNFSTYFLPVNQFKAEAARLGNQTVRVQGKVVGSSAVYNPQTDTLRFVLTAKGQSLPVEYTGAVPNEQFKDVDAIVKGHLGPGGVFVAQKLAIQCPDHYSAAPSGNA